jgi:hypothetical protein
MRDPNDRAPRDEIFDADNRAQRGNISDNKLIEKVYDGMRVFDSAGKDLGKVEFVRMGDPEAVTTAGQEHSMFAPGAARVAGRNELLGEHDDADEPELPEPERSSMLRMGFFKVESGGFLGIGEKERYVRADLIADVSGDRVTLAVTAEQLPSEADDDREPLDT